jgi:hypothetical protein
MMSASGGSSSSLAGGGGVEEGPTAGTEMLVNHNNNVQGQPATPLDDIVASALRNADMAIVRNIYLTHKETIKQICYDNAKLVLAKDQEILSLKDHVGLLDSRVLELNAIRTDQDLVIEDQRQQLATAVADADAAVAAADAAAAAAAAAQQNGPLINEETVKETMGVIEKMLLEKIAATKQPCENCTQLQELITSMTSQENDQNHVFENQSIRETSLVSQIEILQGRIQDLERQLQDADRVREDKIAQLMEQLKDAERKSLDHEMYIEVLRRSVEESQNKKEDEGFFNQQTQVQQEKLAEEVTKMSKQSAILVKLKRDLDVREANVLIKEEKRNYY